MIFGSDIFLFDIYRKSKMNHEHEPSLAATTGTTEPLRIIVDAACKAFHKSVSAYIAKSRSRPQQKQHRGDENIDGRRAGDDDNNAATKECLIFELVDHANHVLRTLTAKRTSLKNALLAFREASELHVQQFSAATTATTTTGQEDRKRRQIVLRNWFANYIRLRDGFVLLESGERRHPHDGDFNTDIHSSKAAASSSSLSNQKFQSKLNGAFRSDGITRKFSSSNGYTGTGYDEVYDEDVGIKRRLLEALFNIDCNGGRRRRSVASINDELFDGEKYGNGAQFWEGLMDEHIRDSKVLRDTLNTIQVKFVNDINNYLLNDDGGDHHCVDGSGTVKKKKKMKLTLVTDDKFERMTLGDIVDIARQGNAFALQDEGGSLPIGMTVHDWRQRFGLIPAVVEAQHSSSSTSSSRVEKVTVQKKRKVILEDSSEEDEEDGDTTASCKKNTAATRRLTTDPAVADSKKTTATATIAINNDDGLTVRVRKATDVSDANDMGERSMTGGVHVIDLKDTTSIDEMKRRLGVNNAQLERGRELLEDEQLLSRIAADEEDMQEEMLRDGNSNANNLTGSNSAFSTHAALLRKIYSSRNEVRTNNCALLSSNSNEFELLRESQEYWAAFDESVLRWNDHLQSLGEMRKDISDGMLDDSSDRVRANPMLQLGCFCDCLFPFQPTCMMSPLLRQSLRRIQYERTFARRICSLV